MTEWTGSVNAAANPRRAALMGLRSLGAVLAAVASPARLVLTLAISGAMAITISQTSPQRELRLAGLHETVPAQDAPTWVTVSRPLAMFALETPFFSRDARSIEARRHVTGGGREEIHLFGSADAPPGQVRFIAYRPGSEAGSPGSLFLDVARRAADSGYAVARSGAPVPLTTKFGPIETADIVLSAGKKAQPCLAFRLLADEVGLRMSGFACGADPKTMDRNWLACFLDRLDLVAAGEDKALKAWFAAAERNRLPMCRTGVRRSVSMLSSGSSLESMQL